MNWRRLKHTNSQMSPKIVKREMMKMRRMRRWPRGVYLEKEGVREDEGEERIPKIN